MLLYSLKPYSGSPLTEAQILNRPLYAAPAGCLIMSPSSDVPATLSSIQVLKSVKPTLALVPVHTPFLGANAQLSFRAQMMCFSSEKLFPTGQNWVSSSTWCAQRILQCTFLAPPQPQVPNWFWSPQVVCECYKGKLHDCLTSIVFLTPGAQPVFEDWLNKQKFKTAFCKIKNHLP